MARIGHVLDPGQPLDGQIQPGDPFRQPEPFVSAVGGHPHPVALQQHDVGAVERHHAADLFQERIEDGARPQRPGKDQPDIAQGLGQDPLLPLAFVEPGVDQRQGRLFGGHPQALEFHRREGAVVLPAIELDQPQRLAARPERNDQHGAVMQMPQDGRLTGMDTRDRPSAAAAGRSLSGPGP